MLSTLLALGADSLVHAQQSVLEVIDLKYRSAEQIVPILNRGDGPAGRMDGNRRRGREPHADRERDDFEQDRQHVQ